MTDNVYFKLREFLDMFPLGYPETESGVEIEILKKLYTPEEAEIAINLSIRPEPANVIADRTGQPPAELEASLEAMAKKGLVFRSERQGNVLYNAVPFMIGLYEYSINKIDKELAALFRQYYDEAYQAEMGMSNIPGFKVTPIQEHIASDITLYPYHKVEEDIRSARVIGVANCVCRTEARLLGHGCDKPMETCLSFGTAAEYYIHSGLGREISADEAVQILKTADDAGLVHAGANAQHLSNICNCCPCCCASMKGIVEKGHDKQKYMNALFEPLVDEELCTACEQCVHRCPVGAINVDDIAEVDRSLCLGCGLCASGCDSEAITMTLRQDRQEPYKNARELFTDILKRKKEASA
ncbi:MAG: 4Fe-4S binding protein [Desulfobacteraceae bacterium]|nr:4Fe-4S binding protein [Desulfobacteraceae bacterium]